jgi:hypothetical protein
MGRGPAVALVAVIAAIGAQPAHAAKVQVAGPTAEGATLQAFHRHTKLCLDLLVRNETISTSCQSTPRRPGDTATGDESEVTKQGFLGGATTSDVARVQVVQVDGTTTDATVVPGPAAYPGLGFFVLDYDRTHHKAVKLVRLFDAAGTELAALGPGFIELPHSPSVQIGRVGTLRAVAYDLPEFEPSPLEPERLAHFECVALRHSTSNNLVGRGCASEALLGSVPVAFDVSVGGCHRVSAVFGFAGPGVARMDVVLGDGRVVHGKPLALRDGVRVLAAVARPDMAVRRVAAFDATGRRVDSQDLGIEPPTANCGSDLINFGWIPPLGGVPTSDAPPPGGTALAVRVEDGDRLCIGVDELADAQPCYVPTADAVYLDAERRYRDGSSGVAGLVDPHVATVSILLATRKRITIPTVPAPDAAGPYQAVSRAYAAHLPRGAVALSFRDAAGHALDSRVLDRAFDAVSAPRTILRSGATRLAVSHRPKAVGGSLCGEVLIGAQAPDPADCDQLLSYYGRLEVSCATRQVAIYGLLGNRTRVDALTAPGAHVRARVDRATGAYLIVLPRHARLRALRLAGPGGLRVSHALPPATEQCGYSSLLYLAR